MSERAGEQVPVRRSPDVARDRVTEVRGEVIRMLSGPAPPSHAADVAYQRAFVETQSSSGWTGYAPMSEAEFTPASTQIPGNEPMLLRGILVGWTLFGLASGIGLLVGWLIWG